PIPAQGMGTDPAVMDFDRAAQAQDVGAERLLRARHEFQQGLIQECFDFGLLGGRLSYLFRIVDQNRANIQVSGLGGEMGELENQVRQAIVAVGEKFQAQLRSMASLDILPVEDGAIQDRIRKASAYFNTEFAKGLDSLVRDLALETDNKELAKRLKNGLDNLRETAMEKGAAVRSCGEGFDTEAYLRAVSHARVDALPTKASKAKAPDYSESDIEHPELFKQLRDWRTRISKTEGRPAFQVMHQKTLVQIVVHLPDDETALLKVKGVGPKILENYGDEILELVRNYRREKGIETVILPKVSTPVESDSGEKKKTAPRKKGESAQETLALFKAGKSVDEIAQARSFALSTIQGHLAGFVEAGELPLDDLVPPDRVAAISQVLDQENHNSLTQVKNALGGDYEYGEIRLVMAHRRSLEKP
ncbi:MAG: helix-turn-helix domain-containing protein, partial [Desulfobacterales bacterium]|nr:helix-turn-helix domain-containing protein [Desulfobacterales bacterium]